MKRGELLHRFDLNNWNLIIGTATHLTSAKKEYYLYQYRKERYITGILHWYIY